MNYDNLAALSSVHEAGSVQAAAKLMGLTQPALSIRIRKLEEESGGPVLIRGPSMELTALGARLLVHFQKVRGLESELDLGLSSDRPSYNIAMTSEHISCGVLREFFKSKICEQVLIKVEIEYREIAFERFRRGEIMGCVSSHSVAVAGGQVRKLCDLPYRLIASPKFVKKFFEKGFSRERLLEVPTALYGKHDQLHEEFLKKMGLDFNNRRPPIHYFPSAESLIQSALASVALTVVPEPLCKSALSVGKLVDLNPRTRVKFPLYWHSSKVEGREMKTISEEMVRSFQSI